MQPFKRLNDVQTFRPTVNVESEILSQMDRR